MAQHLVNVQFSHGLDIILVAVFAHVASFKSFHDEFIEGGVYLAKGYFCIGGGGSQRVEKSVLVVSQVVLKVKLIFKLLT